MIVEGKEIGRLFRRIAPTRRLDLHFSLLLLFLSAFTAVYLDPAIAIQSSPPPPARGFTFEQFLPKGPISFCLWRHNHTAVDASYTTLMPHLFLPNPVLPSFLPPLSSLFASLPPSSPSCRFKQIECQPNHHVPRQTRIVSSFANSLTSFFLNSVSSNQNHGFKGQLPLRQHNLHSRLAAMPYRPHPQHQHQRQMEVPLGFPSEVLLRHQLPN